MSIRKPNRSKPEPPLPPLVDAEILPVPAAEAPLASTADRPFKTALNFFTVEGLDPALVASDWSIEEELRVLVDLAKNHPRATIRMEAIDQIRRYLKDALITCGLIRQNQATLSATLPDGRQLTATTTQYQMPNGGASETERMLLDAARASHTLLTEESNVPTEEIPLIDAAGPPRDLGGGGLCPSARAEADAAAAAEAARLACNSDLPPLGGDHPTPSPDQQESPPSLPPIPGQSEPDPLGLP